MSTLEALVQSLQAAAPPKPATVIPFSGGRAGALSWRKPTPAGFKDYPELEDVAEALADWLPLATLDGRCVMVARKEPHAVACFDEGFQPLAPTLELFFEKALQRAGQKSAQQKLAAAFDKARAFKNAQQFAAAEKALARVLAEHPMAPDPAWPRPDLDRALGHAFLLLGYSQWKQARPEDARTNYVAGLAYGNFTCAANLLVVDIRGGNLERAIAVGSKVLAESGGTMSTDDEVSLVGNLVVAHWCDGDSVNGTKVLKQWLKGRGPADRKALKEDIASWLTSKPELRTVFDAAFP